MPLTRHFYELDEVISALQYSLAAKFPRAAFWLWELVVSEEFKLAYDTLLGAWVEHGNGLYAELMRPIPVLPREWTLLLRRIEIAINTSCIPTPHPVPYKTKSLAFLNALGPSADVSWFISLESAISERKIATIDKLLRTKEHYIWPSLGLFHDFTILRELIPPECAPHAAACFLCSSQLQPPQSAPLYDSLWSDYYKNLGRRRGRAYAIPVEALHAGTTRGALSKTYTNIYELLDTEHLLYEGCAFWRRILSIYGAYMNIENTIEFPTDELKEIFYETYFPDDIPDEWSRVEHEKSHGRGCAAKKT